MTQSTRTVPQYVANITPMLRKGNVALAENVCRQGLDECGPAADLYFLLAYIVKLVGLKQFSLQYLHEALRLQPNHAEAKKALPAVESMPDPAPAAGTRYLLIKSWGCGFWSDVDHVLGQLLFCEMTNRVPVVHWGSNSLFGGSERQSAFEFFFKPVSSVTLEELERQPAPFYPPKWNPQNLRVEEFNKWEGGYSRQASLYFLARSEVVAVSDFLTEVVELLPYVDPSHPMYGKSVDEAYRYLFKKYLHPQPDILQEVVDFVQKHLGGARWIAVHVRGTDKGLEEKALHERNQKYHTVLYEQLKLVPDARILLLTDDENVVADYRQRYGERILTTSATRASGKTGVHYKQDTDKRQLGREVMIDTYLAAQCERFIGSGDTNVSSTVPYLKDWEEGTCVLVHPSNRLQRNWFIHNW